MHVGDLLRVRPGQTVQVIRPATGKVIGATLDTSGGLDIRSVKVGAQIMLVQMVAQA